MLVAKIFMLLNTLKPIHPFGSSKYWAPSFSQWSLLLLSLYKPSDRNHCSLLVLLTFSQSEGLCQWQPAIYSPKKGSALTFLWISLFALSVTTMTPKVLTLQSHVILVGVTFDDYYIRSFGSNFGIDSMPELASYHVLHPLF